MSVEKKKRIAIIAVIAAVLLVAAIIITVVAVTHNSSKPEPSPIDDSSDESLDTVIPPGERLNNFLDSLNGDKAVHLTYTANVDGEDIVYNEYHLNGVTYTEVNLGGKLFKILKNSDGEYELDTAAKSYTQSSQSIPNLIPNMLALRNPKFAVNEADVEMLDNLYYNYDQVDTGDNVLRVYFSVSTDEINRIKLNNTVYTDVSLDFETNPAVFSLDGYQAK